MSQSGAVEEIRCVTCGAKDERETMLICDKCGLGQHVNCLGEMLCANE